ncbi:hypothetical protein ACROYT_G017883 [Oculina patagonica]
MLIKLPLVIFLGTLTLKGGLCANPGKNQCFSVQASSTSCNQANKGLVRMVNQHLEFCNGHSWVRLPDEMAAQNSRENPGIDCKDIKNREQSQVDGLYWLDPDAGSHSNAFLAYCDMTTNCNNIPFTEIIFVDHQTGAKIYFRRQTNLPITAAAKYGNDGSPYGLWHGVGANNAYSYQLLICDHSFYSGFFVSGYTGNCYKRCNSWCGDLSSPYFRTASTSSSYKGVAFNTNGHRPLSNRLISVGLR